MIFEWLNFIRRRYEHLDQYVNKIISQKVILVSLAVKELRLVGEVYKNLTELTVELNTLLSFHLFFLISVSMVLTLHGLSFSLVILYSLSSRLAGLNYVVAFFVSYRLFWILQNWWLLTFAGERCGAGLSVWKITQQATEYFEKLLDHFRRVGARWNKKWVTRLNEFHDKFARKNFRFWAIRNRFSINIQLRFRGADLFNHYFAV